MTLIRRIALALALIAGIAPAFAQVPAPVPALPDAERRNSCVLSGSTGPCSVGFQLYQDSNDFANWLTVFVNGVQIPQSGNWTITSPSGPIVNLARPISDAVLTFTTAQTGTVQIVGAQRPRRLSEYTENRGVAARDLNQAVNGIEAQLRELWDRQFRTVQAPPGETLNLLPVQASRASMNACFDANGMLTSCISASSGSFAAGNGITFTGTNPTTVSTATYSAGTGITFAGSNPITISVSASSGTPAIPSRATAIGLDLHLFGAIQTIGYSAAGDGGGATFKNVGAAAFTDTYITGTPTLVGGSGYTNGTYLGVPLGGGTGLGCASSVTVSGGAVTSVSIVIPCAGYVVGDVLTTPNSFVGGTGSGFTYTVTSISTPKASFTDLAGTHWQYVTDQSGVANAKQFGCVGDWNGSDGSATNNLTCLLSASAWASLPVSTSSAQVNGNQIIIPRGSYMTCGTFNGIYNIPLPMGVRFTGAGIGATTLKECAADSSGTHYIELCDSNAGFGEFGCKIEQMTIDTSQVTPGTSGIAVLYSNSGQQFPLAENLEINSGNRGCLFYEIGKGGAANAIFNNIDCESRNTNTNNAVFINSSNTLVVLKNWVIGCAPTICTRNGVLLQKGAMVIDSMHIEGTSTGIQMANANGDLSWISNVTVASPCTQAMLFQATDLNNTAVYSNIQSNGCKLLTNGHSGGSDVAAGNIVLPRVFNP
jgi:hypothetical protein